MRVKLNVIPGIVQAVRFISTQTSEMEIACSRPCRPGHYRLRSLYTVQTQAEYDAWFTEEAALLTALC